ncbi:hypothetical protein FQY83_03300 [Luteimonas marina]|uniref:Uncharacterized protein n=1 Tax=Luteimonas marina TaxID=488485 RepID=A0A5C5UDQ7_9GAMM|nr:hypothetical protein [Luteimonas marina]TWT23660.1 hypothetical protein FQY83_03300 [Luteimonas marina]
MIRHALVVIAMLCLTGCINLYKRVDSGPDGEPMAFNGIRDHLATGPLHVMQIHGMGDHSGPNDCGKSSQNIKLQLAIADRLGYRHDMGYGASDPGNVTIGGTVAGTYSVRRYSDPKGEGNDLYFSCVTWGETGRIIKQGMLELNDKFLEENENERHRAPINRAAKRFVNRSFSDPLIYQGPMGAYIRRVVWDGIEGSIRLHVHQQADASLASMEVQTLQAKALAFMGEVQVAIISDSLGSRIVFDVVCSVGGGDCQGGPHLEMLPPQRASRNQADATAGIDAMLAGRLAGSVRSVYMLANQLPLLELAYLEPPAEGTSLEHLIGTTDRCYRPLLGPYPEAARIGAAGRTEEKIQMVAFTDANDALSYHLSDAYKSRCSSAYVMSNGAADDVATEGARLERKVELSVEFINVTFPNAIPRWLFVYSSLGKAHSGGFKGNRRAVGYLVDGSHR